MSLIMGKIAVGNLMHKGVAQPVQPSRGLMVLNTAGRGGEVNVITLNSRWNNWTGVIEALF